MQFIHICCFALYSLFVIIHIDCEYGKFIKLEKLSFRDDLV